MLKGHVTICKVYSDGTKEVVLDKGNMITGGLGYSLADLNTGAGSILPLDLTPYYFQVGTSSMGYDDSVAASSYFYQLSTPFDWEDYGADTDLDIVKRYRGFVASSLDVEAASPSYSEIIFKSPQLSSTVFSGIDQYFSLVRHGMVTKVFMDSFEAEIILDENSANGKAITEMGLFAKNPKGFSQDSPLLLAYRSFAALDKTSDFSLVIHWSIGFLGLSTNVDDYYTGGGTQSLSSPIPAGLTTSRATGSSPSPGNY